MKNTKPVTLSLPIDVIDGMKRKSEEDFGPRKTTMVIQTLLRKYIEGEIPLSLEISRKTNNEQISA